MNPNGEHSQDDLGERDWKETLTMDQAPDYQDLKKLIFETAGELAKRGMGGRKNPSSFVKSPIGFGWENGWPPTRTF